MKRLTVLSIFVVLIIGLVATRDNTNRQKRQSFSYLNQLINPEFFQYIGLVPLSAGQTTAAGCQALAGQAAPDGCSYVPVIVDSNNVPVNCRVSCLSTDTIPSQFQGQFDSPILPGQFTVNDQSNLDVFVGNSYFLFTPSPSTIRTAATTSTTTAATATGTASSTTTAVTATTTTVATTTVLTGDALIRTCIDAGLVPDPNCSFNGMGTGIATALTCAQTCASDPSGTTPKDCTAGSHIDQCLCDHGAPDEGCTYLLTGTTSPLTCAKICKPRNFG
ncbi:hypothetical protein RvY_13063 [Ramazzottius varieornatus]|uniref:Uncharacterized protein n=1 Tax=Ramazzottius varieornatus TaxID=947166 RepID=A0A1D1VNU7_RAMVA|nr:hypothetical protein RvY_13063 [Ramazzottius varieornatus]